MYGDQVQIIGVPGLAEASAFPGFVRQTDSSSITHIPDSEGIIWERFGVTRQRTYVFINDDGTHRTAGYGSLPEDVQGLINS